MNLSRHYISDAAMLSSLPSRGCDGLVPSGVVTRAGRLDGLRQALRGLPSAPDPEPVTPALRAYPR